MLQRDLLGAQSSHSTPLFASTYCNVKIGLLWELGVERGREEAVVPPGVDLVLDIEERHVVLGWCCGMHQTRKGACLCCLIPGDDDCAIADTNQ